MGSGNMFNADFNVDLGSVMGGGAPGQHSQINTAAKGQMKWGPQIIASQVQGWKDAGMHPLFAMGGAGAIGPPSWIGKPDTGTRVAVSSKSIRPEEAAMNTARIGLIKAQTNEIEERAAASRAARAAEALAARPGAKALPLRYEEMTQTIPLPGKPGQVPGSHPAWTQHNLSFGNHSMKLWAPAQETSEIFESMAMWPLIYSANQNAIHKWAKGIFKDKSNIGKLTTFGKWLIQMAGDKLK